MSYPMCKFAFRNPQNIPSLQPWNIDFCIVGIEKLLFYSIAEFFSKYEYINENRTLFWDIDHFKIIKEKR